MHPDTLAFLDVLYERGESARSSARLTLTAIHPNGKFPTPSRHIELKDRVALLDTQLWLSACSRMGWGASLAVGLRKRGGSRWKRGCSPVGVALPAFYTDMDGPTAAALIQLRGER